LLRQGISTWNRLADGSVVLERVITAYKVSTLNVPDPAWLDIMVPKTMTRIRYDWAVYVTLLYPRHKLANDDSPAANNNDAVVTPRRMLGSWASRCKLYERQAWIEDVTRTVSESRFERDASDKNRLNGQQQVLIIGNLMVLAAALEFQV
jgi:phage tail sheath gpL-like